jgi:threonine/homoserine/homoserine lactone efflux protein
VTWLVNALIALRVPLALFGGAFLLWMAWQLVRAPLAAQAAATAPVQASEPNGSSARGWQYFAGTFVLTLSNPATIFSFIAIFGAMGSRAAITSPAVMVAGVLIGSALWWLFLSSAVGRLRGRFDTVWRRRVNRVSALVLAAFALWQLASLASGS